MSNLTELPSAIRNYVDAFNTGDFLRLMDQFTPDAMIVGVLGSATLAQAEPVWSELYYGMQMHLHPQSVAIDGETVVVRYIETGCFVGAFRGIPDSAPTGKTYRVLAIEWFELAGGKIARRWGARDFDAIRKQVLGAA